MLQQDDKELDSDFVLDEESDEELEYDDTDDFVEEDRKDEDEITSRIDIISLKSTTKRLLSRSLPCDTTCRKS